MTTDEYGRIAIDVLERVLGFKRSRVQIEHTKTDESAFYVSEASMELWLWLAAPAGPGQPHRVYTTPYLYFDLKRPLEFCSWVEEYVLRNREDLSFEFEIVSWCRTEPTGQRRIVYSVRWIHESKPTGIKVEAPEGEAEARLRRLASLK